MATKRRKGTETVAPNKKNALLHNTSKKESPSEVHVISDILLKEEPSSVTDHYVITELKSNDDDDIDFVLSKSRIKDEAIRVPPTECREEIHINESLTEYDQTRTLVNTKEIVEHVCGRCFLTFRTIPALKRHLEYCVFNNEKEYRKAEMLKNIEMIEKEAFIMEKKDICFCCGDSYDTCHLGHISCPECPKTFKTQLSLERHVCLVHSENADFPCGNCNYRVRTNALLELHKKQHQQRGKPFGCKECGKDFTRQYHLKRHLKFSSCGDGNSELLCCKVCSKEFYRVDNLRVHLRSHLGKGLTKKADYACPSCKKCFYSLSTLNIHIRTHTGERPFDCDICDNNFPSLVALRKHRRYHTGEKPYSCSVCSQNFAVKEVLNRHMKRHTGEKPHACHICTKRFIQATQLRNHLRVHILNFGCEVCSEKFKTKKQLENHQKKQHKEAKSKDKKKKAESKPSREDCKEIRTRSKKNLKSDENLDESQESRFWCEDCKECFSCAKNLHRHLKTFKHLSQVNPDLVQSQVTCTVCGETCLDAKSLAFHNLKEHVNIRCEQCGTEFAQLHLFKQHMQTTHLAVPVASKEREESVQAPLSQPVELDPLKSEQDKGGIVIEEFIITSFDEEQDENTSHLSEEFTVIAKPSENTSSKQNSKIKLPAFRAELKKSLEACLNEEAPKKAPQETMSADDRLITENVGRLLDMLVDCETLVKFGWPGDSVETVLCKVIENCGHKLRKRMYTDDYGTRMREYVKLLFTVVIQNDSIMELLNNYSIDEVIDFVLSNEDEVD